MKKISSIIKAVRRFFGIAKYRYYVIVLRERQSMPGEVPDTFVSGNIFFSKRAAKVYAKWLQENTILYDKADIESFATDTPHAYAELTYPRCEDEKMTVTYVMPE